MQAALKNLRHRGGKRDLKLEMMAAARQASVDAAVASSELDGIFAFKNRP